MDLVAILNSTLCAHEISYVGNIIFIHCMSVCDFVLILLTDFELDAKT